MIHVKKAFVIGHPIKHSRSPLIHGTWLAEHGIDGSYEAIDVAPVFAGTTETPSPFESGVHRVEELGVVLGVAQLVEQEVDGIHAAVG